MRSDQHLQESSRVCSCCDGTQSIHTAYTHMGPFHGLCPRCEGSGFEPAEHRIHQGLVIRHPRSRKVWAVYGSYEGGQARPHHPGPAWGIHRMIPDRGRGGHYVWQIRVLSEAGLLKWPVVGYGDAWDHTLMESDPLRTPA